MVAQPPALLRREREHHRRLDREHQPDQPVRGARHPIPRSSQPRLVEHDDRQRSERDRRHRPAQARAPALEPSGLAADSARWSMRTVRVVEVSHASGSWRSAAPPVVRHQATLLHTAPAVSGSGVSAAPSERRGARSAGVEGPNAGTRRRTRRCRTPGPSSPAPHPCLYRRSPPWHLARIPAPGDPRAIGTAYPRMTGARGVRRQA